MAKGYWIAHVDVNDPEGYKDYVAAAKIAFDKYGANFLARGGAYEAPEGKGRARNVVIEFRLAPGGAGLLPFARIPGRQSDPPEICRRRDGAGRRSCRSEAFDCEQFSRALTQSP